MGASSPQLAQELRGPPRVPNDVARFGLDAQAYPGVARRLKQVVQRAPQVGPGIIGQVSRVGPPHVVRVAGAGAERDDIGAELRDQTDQPDRLSGLLSAKIGVGVDEVEGRQDAGDAHTGAVERGPNDGDLSLVDVATKGGAPDRGKVPVRKWVAGLGDRRGNLLGGLPTEGPREDAETLGELPGAVVLGVVHSFTSDPVSTTCLPARSASVVSPWWNRSGAVMITASTEASAQTDPGWCRRQRRHSGGRRSGPPHHSGR